MAIGVSLLAFAVLILGGFIVAVTAVLVVWIVTRRRRQGEGFPIQPAQPPGTPPRV